MVFHAFRKCITGLAKLTPNAWVPQAGVALSGGRLGAQDCAEVYLLARILFAFALATVLPKSDVLVGVVVFIQVCSLLYLIRIMFPVGDRDVRDPGRTVFFALTHYVEIGLAMGYVYWNLNAFNQETISLSKSVYFSFVTMTTIGFGDIFPATDHARLIVTIHSVIGILMLATIVGLLVALQASGKSASKQQG